MTKKCGKCKLELDVSLFNKNKGFKDGYHFYCKKCRKPMDKSGRDKNREIPFEEKTRGMTEKLCIKCEEIKPIDAFGKDSVRTDGLYTYCKECQKKDVKARTKQEKPVLLTKSCSRCKLVKDASCFNADMTKKCGLSSLCNECKAASRKIGYQKNKKNIINKVGIYRKKKIKNDIQFKLQALLRQRMCSALRYSRSQNFSNRTFAKPGSAVSDLGCSVLEFKIYIESLWKPGMTWDNWGMGAGKWNLDHKEALCLLDLTDREQFLKACHYTNLQPIWHEEHVIKSGKDRKKKRQSLPHA